MFELGKRKLFLRRHQLERHKYYYPATKTIRGHKVGCKIDAEDIIFAPAVSHDLNPSFSVIGHQTDGHWLRVCSEGMV